MSLVELSGPTGFMAVTANQIAGEVLLSLPEVDIMDPNDPNIYAALDDGCHSTRHSSEWGKMCNEKLKALGLEFKWTTRSTTSFVGTLKDLEKGTCSAKHDGTRRAIPLFKCCKTGLLLINLP